MHPPFSGSLDAVAQIADKVKIIYPSIFLLYWLMSGINKGNDHKECLLSP
jgi:hypothetical protein